MMTRKKFESDPDLQKRFPLWKEFYDFWEIYDRKVSFLNAIRAWHKLNFQERKQAMEAAPAYVKSTPNLQYRCHASTWLNQKRFYDEIIEPSKPNDPFLNVALDIVNQFQHGSGNQNPIRSIY